MIMWFVMVREIMKLLMRGKVRVLKIVRLLGVLVII